MAMNPSGDLAFVHAYVLIPLVSCIFACAATSMVVARGPKVRLTVLAARLVACAAVFSLFDLIGHLEFDPSRALIYQRVGGTISLLMGPIACQLLVEPLPELRVRFGRYIGPLWIWTIGLLTVHVATPWMIRDLIWTDWGWRYEYGALFPLLAVHIGACSALGLSSLFRLALRLFQQSGAASRAIVSVAALGFAVSVLVTDVALPMLGIAAPRLGALAVALLAVLLWWISLSAAEYGPPESAFARDVFDALSDGVALVTSDGSIRVANPALVRLSGFSSEALMERSISDVMRDDLAVSQDAVSDHETFLRTPGDSMIPVSLSISNLTDQDGSSRGSVFVFRDQREILQLRRRLVTAARQAAVGELAAGIAHEVNNPIAFIQSNLHSLHRNEMELADHLDKGSSAGDLSAELREASHLIGQSLQGISRVSAIVNEVRGFAHLGPGDPQWNDINALLDSAVNIAMPRLRRSAKLVREYSEMPLCLCAGQDLKQVFLDLLLAAAQSVSGNGTIRLSTDADEIRVRVRIEDDGRGISADRLERIFEPLIDPGLGNQEEIDFSLSYQIVRQQGGDMHIEAEAGRGTIVSVLLPIAGRPERESSTQLESSEPQMREDSD